MKKIERIETIEQLTTWATAVNNGLSIHDKCDYQDIFARSNMATIKKLFMETNGDKKLILCSIYNTMDYQTVETLLIHWANVKAQGIIDKELEEEYKEINRKKSELYTKEATFTECLKGYWKRIRTLKANIQAKDERITKLLQAVERAEGAARIYKEQAKENADKARRYDAIKNALNK